MRLASPAPSAKFVPLLQGTARALDRIAAAERDAIRAAAEAAQVPAFKGFRSLRDS